MLVTQETNSPSTPSLQAKVRCAISAVAQCTIDQSTVQRLWPTGRPPENTHVNKSAHF